MSTQYHKIYGPYKRHVDGPDRGKLIIGEWTKPEFGLLKDLPWVWTEKLDGTNVRVIWDGHRVSFAGKTDRADMPSHLLEALEQSLMEELFEQTFGEQPAILYGEGIGPKIQKGGKYADDQAFVLFDVRVGDWWLRRNDVEEIAVSLGIDAVPNLYLCSVQVAIDIVSSGLTSAWAARNGRDAFEAEGLVGTPKEGMLTRSGRRIIMKIKARDFRNGR